MAKIVNDEINDFAKVQSAAFEIYKARQALREHNLDDPSKQPETARKFSYMLGVLAGILDSKVLEDNDTKTKKTLIEKAMEYADGQGKTKEPDPKTGKKVTVDLTDEFLLWLIHKIEDEATKDPILANDLATLTCCHHKGVCNHCGCR